MDLTTRYLGMTLRTPLVPSASPLSEDVDNIKRMADAGASAIVLHSLFEEQIRREQHQIDHHLTENTYSFAEALSFFPEPPDFKVGPEEYLDHIRKAKKGVDIPIIASLNGCSMGGWLRYAKMIEQAGADALELNIYYIPTDMTKTSQEIEENYVQILKAVKSVVKIPVAIKLSPFFSNLAYMAKRLDDAGAHGLVLFNRFYQPDIELENLEVKSEVLLSTPHSLRYPLRWISILYGRIGANLAGSGGVHRAEDAVKLLMAGASVTMLCSVLLSRGIPYLKTLEQKLGEWMEEHAYTSVKQIQGCLSHAHCDKPDIYERSQYVRILQSFKTQPIQQPSK